MINKLIIISFSIFFSIPNFSANSSEMTSTLETSCKNAIENVKIELRQKKFFIPFRDFKGKTWNSEVKIDSSFIQENFYDYPLNRSKSVIFVLGDTQNLYSSPRLMANLASKIINRCQTVGLIEFAYWFEGGRQVGLLENGIVKVFDRTEPNSQYAKTFKLPNGLTRTKFKWGHYFYL